jgi:hypothetical protein
VAFFSSIMRSLPSRSDNSSKFAELTLQGWR